MARFGLDDIQAQAILDMQLKRLQGLERDKLLAEYRELEERLPTTPACWPDPEQDAGGPQGRAHRDSG